MPRPLLTRVAIPLALITLGLVLGALSRSATPVRASPPGTVSAVDYAFDPPALIVPVGTTVTWTNTTDTTPSPTSHTVTADTGLFDSGNLGPGQAFSVRFTTPGTYNYHCRYHQSLGMVGSIVVQAQPSLPVRAYLPAIFNGR